MTVHIKIEIKQSNRKRDGSVDGTEVKEGRINNSVDG